MNKSTPQSLNSSGNARLRALIKSDRSLLDDVADAKVCNDIAISLFNLRSQAGITQKELAQKLGVKQSNVSRWEQVGYQGFKVKMLSKIVRTLGGKLNLSIALPTDTIVTCIAFRQVQKDKIEVTNPDGWTLSRESSKTTEFISLNVAGNGVEEYANI